MSDDKSTPIRLPIVVRTVTEDLGKSGKDLKYCFFLPTEIHGFFNFFDENARTLATGVSKNIPFPLLLDGLVWTITLHHIDDQRAHGTWTNSAPVPLGPSDGSAQSGSFQASSSGDEGRVAGASA